jgi:hypothetical protein
VLLVVALTALAGSSAAAGGRREASFTTTDAADAAYRASEPPPCPVNPACIQHRTEARPGRGYAHLVHISNACDAVAECSVSTDVNRTVKKVVIDPGTEQTVVTTTGARTRDFEATVNCSLQC